MKKTAWVAGASGLVGGHLMSQLCAHKAYDRVIAFVRSPSDAPWSNHSKAQQWPVDYANLNALQLESKVDDLFCALGTTRKRTPDPVVYRRIDVDYPNDFAQLGLGHNAQFYGAVSAHGASTKSLSGYLKMKGDMESGLQNLHYSRLAIARPGMLKGDRGEFRMLEKVGEVFTDLLPGNYRTIHAQDVAAALIDAANSTPEKLTIMASKTMQGAFARAQMHDR
jgi:uncharacterized protein YbjT (DUF2867 family)